MNTYRLLQISQIFCGHRLFLAFTRFIQFNTNWILIQHECSFELECFPFRTTSHFRLSLHQNNWLTIFWIIRVHSDHCGFMNNNRIFFFVVGRFCCCLFNFEFSKPIDKFICLTHMKLALRPSSLVLKLPLWKNGLKSDVNSNREFIWWLSINRKKNHWHFWEYWWKANKDFIF